MHPPSLAELAARELAKAGPGPYEMGEAAYGELDYARFKEATPRAEQTLEAARRGRADWLARLRGETPPAPWHPWTTYAAADNGREAALRAAAALGCPWHPDTTTAAAETGRGRMIRVAVGLGCPWGRWTIYEAAAGGRMGCLRVCAAMVATPSMVQRGCRWDPRATRVAARHGHTAIMRFLAARGCPWDPWTTHAAAEVGQTRSLRVAAELGCPWHPETRTVAFPGVHDLLDELGCPPLPLRGDL